MGKDPFSAPEKRMIFDHCRCIALFCAIWISIAAVSAWAMDPVRGLAMGFYDPQEQIGHVTFSLEDLDDSSRLTFSASFPLDIIRLVNQNRRNAGLLPLKANPILTATSQEHSDRMRNTECFDHQCPGEYSPAERICLLGYGMYGGSRSFSDCIASGGGPGPGDGSCYIGEVIAAGYPNPSSVVTAWMASPGHYQILMHPQLREIGAGFAAGGAYRTYWTVDVGSQPNVLPVFINDDDSETRAHRIVLSLTNEEVSGFGGIDYAQEVAISNQPSFAGAAWEPYSPYKAWDLLQGPGQKTVYVNYRDHTGLEIISADDILLR